jgi:thioredoxin 2
MEPRLLALSLAMTETVQVACGNCGATNRVPLEKMQAGRAPVCGRCKAPLPLGATPAIVTDGTFGEQVERSPVPVLVDFWAPWCGPCRILGPVVEELAAEFAGRIRVAKMNVDDNPATASRFDIRGIPALILFRGGKEASRQVGAQPKSELRRWIERAIA